MGSGIQDNCCCGFECLNKMIVGESICGKGFSSLSDYKKTLLEFRFAYFVFHIKRTVRNIAEHLKNQG